MAIVVKPRNPIIKGEEGRKELDRALKAFKKKVKDSQILKIYHDKMYYEKPSVKNRHQRLIGKYRAQQETLRNKD